MQNTSFATVSSSPPTVLSDHRLSSLLNRQVRSCHCSVQTPTSLSISPSPSKRTANLPHHLTITSQVLSPSILPLVHCSSKTSLLAVPQMPQTHLPLRVFTPAFPVGCTDLSAISKWLAFSPLSGISSNVLFLVTPTLNVPLKFVTHPSLPVLPNPFILAHFSL